jgi:Ca-activated chloride channel family protein
VQDQYHRNNKAASNEDSRAPRAVIVFLLTGAVIIGTVLGLRSGDPKKGSCSGGRALTVEAAPAVAPAVRAAAAAYNETEPNADGDCLTVRVSARAPHETVRLLGGGWSEAAAAARPDVWIPDSTGWLETARLAEPARALLPANATPVAASPVVIAMPRKLAKTLKWPDEQLSWKDVLANEGSSAFWRARGAPQAGPFRVVLAHPLASSSSASAMMSMLSVALGKPVESLQAQTLRELFAKKVILDLERKSEAVPASDEALLADLRQADADGKLASRFSAAPMSEAAVFDYNRGLAADGKPGPSSAPASPAASPAADKPAVKPAAAGGPAGPTEPLVAHYPTDGTVLAKVPFVVLTPREGAAPPAAADGFLKALLGPAGQAAFADAGWRTPDGKNPKLTAAAGFSPTLRAAPPETADPAATASAVETFRGIHQRGNSIAVIDSSGSMKQEVPGSGGKTRMQTAVEAIESALGLVAKDSNLGLWQFSTKLDGDNDYRKLVPIGPMEARVGGVTRRDALVTALRGIKPEGDTGLYDTALAAFETLSANYVPGRPNQVVLLTDGKNDDPGSSTLDDLVGKLKEKFDPRRPVRVMTIAYGDEADTEALERISAATGAKSYPALDANSIFLVIVDALTAK